MRRAPLIAAAAVVVLTAPAAAQSGRVATTRAEREASLPPPAKPHPVRDDGSIVVGHGPEYRAVIRSCTAYFGTSTGTGSAMPSPQGGLGAAPPGANGLPPAPGLQPAPGVQPAPGATPRVGLSTPTSGSASLRPLHSGWRTVGTRYYDGVCYVRDRLGHVQLIHL